VLVPRRTLWAREALAVVPVAEELPARGGLAVDLGSWRSKNCGKLVSLDGD
jgi:hypothetical protein